MRDRQTERETERGRQTERKTERETERERQRDTVLFSSFTEYNITLTQWTK